MRTQPARSSARTRRRFVSVAIVAALGVVAACTTFNGLSVPSEPSGADASPDVIIVTEAGDATKPPQTDGGTGFLDLEDAVRFCVNAFNCPLLSSSVQQSIDVPVDTQHFSSCVDWVNGALPPDRVGVAATAAFLECSAKATTCAAAADCMWLDLLDPADPRCNGLDSGPLTEAGSDPGSCLDDASVAIFCNSSQPVAYNCSNAYWAPGTACRKGTDGSRYCDLATPCGTTEDCTGTFLSYCAVNGHRISYDCAPGGFTCGTDAIDDTDCLTNGILKNCSDLVVGCTGDTVTVCDGLYQAAYDCAAAGGTCDSTFTARCKRPTDTCSPASPGVDTCTGDTIQLCTGGQTKTFDCTSIGLKCLPAAAGQTGHCG